LRIFDSIDSFSPFLDPFSWNFFSWTILGQFYILVTYRPTLPEKNSFRVFCDVVVAEEGRSVEDIEWGKKGTLMIRQ
jgi:hypothetical protein